MLLERLYAELGFPDPSGSNRARLEKALHRTASSVADYLAGVAKHRVGGSSLAKLSAKIPAEPEPFGKLLGEIFESIVPASMHVSHPRYMAHMDSGVSFASIVADFIAAALNQNMLSNELAPAATAVEQQVVRWLAEAAGLPKGSGGTFVAGGTMANLTGLLAARDRALPDLSRKGLSGAPPLRIFASEESHYSLRKAAAVLGLGSDAVIAVRTDNSYRMDVADLRAKIQEERLRGALPFAIVATAGTTSTGSIDPLQAIGRIAKEQSLWMHVDAAYGGALLFSAREKTRLSGIECADSIALDPHKWLWAGKSAGIVLLRDFGSFKPAEYQAPYIDREGSQIDLGRKTVDGSRRFESLKVWMTMRHLGTRRISRLVERTMELTQFLRDELQARGRFQALHEPQTSVLCFVSIAGKTNEENLYRSLLASGEAWISTTKLRGRQTLRTVILNPSTTEDDLREIVRNLELLQGVTAGKGGGKRL